MAIMITMMMMMMHNKFVSVSHKPDYLVHGETEMSAWIGLLGRVRVALNIHKC